MMAVLGAANDEFLEFRADERSDSRDTSGHLGGPVAFLIPGQQVTREGKRQDKSEQSDPKPKVNFAGRLIRAIDHHLHEVQDEEDVHGLGGVMMQSAQ